MARASGPVPYGIVAEIDGPENLLAAARRAREAGYTRMDGYSPFPVHGLTDAMGWRSSQVPWTVFVCGVLGTIGGLGLQVYVSAIAYPMNVGGRPHLSWVSFVPVTFACMVLLASLGAVLAVFAFNGLPKPYHPIFSTPRFEMASQTAFFFCIEAADPNFDVEQVERFLQGLPGVTAVSRVNAEEDGKW
jgi:hypothetical protein